MEERPRIEIDSINILLNCNRNRAILKNENSFNSYNWMIIQEIISREGNILGQINLKLTNSEKHTETILNK